MPESSASSSGEDQIKPLSALFDAAERAGDEYIYTLVRVSGIEARPNDPLQELRVVLSEKPPKSSSPVSVIAESYKRLIAETEPLALVLNLVRCASGEDYDFAPFQPLRVGQWPNFEDASVSACAEFVTSEIDRRGWNSISSLIEKGYVGRLSEVCAEGEAEAISIQALSEAHEACLLFLKQLLARYFDELAKYREWPTYYKRPQFEVLELLTNEEQGLFGFRRHFSNGSEAHFERNGGATTCVNVMLERPINFMVGMLDDLKEEWRVGDRLLHELGVPGRYNESGEWKPIVFPGDGDKISLRVRELAQDDWIQGVLFYIYATCHHVIEFAVRATIDLPREYVGYGKHLHLVKVEREEDAAVRGEVVYDGWFELDDISPSCIESGLATIAVVLNRLAFAYNAEVHWCPKYTIRVSPTSCATPSEEDLSVLDSHWRTFPSGEELVVLESAIDWYNRARRARDQGYAFLAYYISLEQIAIAVTDGKAALNIDYSGEADVSEEGRRNCVEKLYQKHYAENPLMFVQEAYFDCVISLRKRTKTVAELVFGKDHRAIGALFKREDGLSLSDIRGNLAHGRLTRLSSEDRELVGRRIGEMASISREFLTRVIFGLGPEDELPHWSGKHLAGASFDDPRTFLYVTTLDPLRSKSWKIKAHWIEGQR